MTEAPAELATFVQRALGGKKWRKAAAAYALALAQQRVTTIDQVLPPPFWRPRASRASTP